MALGWPAMARTKSRLVVSSRGNTRTSEMNGCEVQQHHP